MNKVSASWYVELLTTCPKCNYGIDLTQTDDFWHLGFQPMEYGTKATTDFNVTCTDCGNEFIVDFEY